MSYGLSLAELETEEVAILPERSVMSLISIGNLTLLNGVNVLNNNNIGVIANVLADDNDSDLDQRNSSNDLITCVVGGSYGMNKCSD